MSGRARTILAVIGVLLVLLLFFFFFIRPRQNELSDVRSDIEIEQGRTSQLQSELDRLRALQADAPKLQAELASIRGYVPRDDQVPNFIFLVQDAANAAGVEFVSIAPQLPAPLTEQAELAQIRTTLGAGGGYFAIQDFIRRLHGLDRAVRIDGLVLTAEDTETGDATIRLQATARIFFEPPVPAGAAATPAPTPSP